LLQFLRELIDVHGMIDVALMSDLVPIPSIFTVASHVAGGKLDLLPSVPQRSHKKYVDTEVCSKPTHQRGPWMPKEVANNLQCSKNTA
jgi:hypothetical protein